MSSKRRTRMQSGAPQRSAGSTGQRSSIPRLPSTRRLPAFSPNSPSSRLEPRRAHPSVDLPERLWACAAALCLAGALSACADMSRVATEPPAGTDIAGTWKLDPQHSTDSRKALDELMKDARKARGGPRARVGMSDYGSDAALLAPPPMVFAPD